MCPPSFPLSSSFILTHKPLWTAENNTRNKDPIPMILNPSSLCFLSQPWGSLFWQKPVKTRSILNLEILPPFL